MLTDISLGEQKHIAEDQNPDPTRQITNVGSPVLSHVHHREHGGKSQNRPQLLQLV